MSSLYPDIYNSNRGNQSQESTTYSIPGANIKIAKMKKLNIFGNAGNKQKYNRQNSVPIVSPSGDTIHRIVSKKEEVSLLFYVRGTQRFHNTAYNQMVNVEILTYFI